GSHGLAVGREREVLQAQAADKAVGHLMDRLKKAGIYDDAMVVVTADHGDAFVPRQPERGVSRTNYEQILWQPLFVKTPHQAKGAVNDDNVMSIDVLPTIADTLGVHIPWHVDGRPVRTAARRDPAVKWFDDDANNALRSSDGGRLQFDAEQGFAKLLTLHALDGRGAGAAWRPGPYGDLFGRDVADLTVGSPTGQTVAMTAPATPF